MARRHARPRHRRLGLHRLEPRRRPAGAGRRGDGDRRPVHRPAREPGRRARGGAPSCSSSTSATRRPCTTSMTTSGSGRRLPPGGADRRAPLGRRPGGRRAHQRRGHRERARRRLARQACRAWSTPPRAAPSTARAGSCRPPRTIPSRPRRRMASPSSPPRATATSSRETTASPTVSLRYGNVFGPRQDPLGEAGVIAIFCGKISEGTQPDRLRRRAPDARLRVRGRRGGGEPARCSTPHAHGPVQHRHRRRRPACSTSSRRSSEHADGPFEAVDGPGAPRRDQAHLAGHLPRAGGARLGAEGGPARGSRAHAVPRCADREGLAPRSSRRPGRRALPLAVSRRCR